MFDSKKILLALVAPCVFLATSATAATLAKPQESYYVKLEGGIAFPNKLHPYNDYNNKKPKSSALFGAGAGYKFHKNGRADISFTRMNQFKFSHNITPNNAAPVSVKQKFESNMVMLNGYFDIADYQGFVPYITAGAGYAQNKAGDYKGSAASGDYSQNGKTKHGFAWSVGAGVNKKIHKNVSVDLGYKYFDLGKFQTSDTVVLASGTSVTSSATKTKIKAHSIIGGVHFHF